MSIQMVGWVLDQDIKDALAKLVLISIANAHNNTTGQCNPSYVVMAKEASCSRRTAIRKVEWLSENGYIEVFETVKKGVNGSNKYKINTDFSGDSLSLGGGDTVTLGGDTGDTRGGDTAVTPIEPEPRTRSITPISPLDILLNILDEETASAILAHRKSLRKPLTERAANLLVNELQKTPDPIAAANEMILRGWVSVKADWINKSDTKQSQSEIMIEAFARA